MSSYSSEYKTIRLQVVVGSNKGYLTALTKGVKYNAWTILSDLTIIECRGFIASNDGWDYHNNVDDSEDVLWVEYVSDRGIAFKYERGFFLSKEEAVSRQQEEAAKFKAVLQTEIDNITLILQIHE